MCLKWCQCSSRACNVHSTLFGAPSLSLSGGLNGILLIVYFVAYLFVALSWELKLGDGDFSTCSGAPDKGRGDLTISTYSGTFDKGHSECDTFDKGHSELRKTSR